MLLSALSAVGAADLLDIALVSVLIYALLVWFKRSKAAVVAKGMLVVSGVYLFSRATGMVMMTGIFHAFFAILIVALVVIFQEELRAIFERIAVWSLSDGRDLSDAEKQGEILVSALADLAKERIGALVVVRGRDPLERHLQGGWVLDGELSEALIKSVFDFHSIGHDGAIVIEGNRVARFGCRLPLSKEAVKTAHFGTRHTAALGLAELTDAFCIVVSEERGTISVAFDGKVEALSDPEELRRRLAEFHADKRPAPRSGHAQEFLRKNQREKAMAFSAAVLFWGLFVMGAKPWRHSYDVPVGWRNLPPGTRVAAVSPEVVRLSLSGQMRDFYWVDARRFEVRIDLSNLKHGTAFVRIGENDVARLGPLRVEEIDPGGVVVELESKTARLPGGVSSWR